MDRPTRSHPIPSHPIKLAGARTPFCSFTQCFAGSRKETESGGGGGLSADRTWIKELS